MIPTWSFLAGDSSDIFNLKGKEPKQYLSLDRPNYTINDEANFPENTFSSSFYRSDDVSATAYFYLNTPSSNLPELGNTELRIKDMKEKVWDKVVKKQ